MSRKASSSGISRPCPKLRDAPADPLGANQFAKVDPVDNNPPTAVRQFIFREQLGVETDAFGSSSGTSTGLA